MQQINVNTTKRVIPMIYGYLTPNDHTHDGWIKIGYTDRQTVEDRINQQTHTSDTYWTFGWKKTAVYDDGSGDTFDDHIFHAYLEKRGIERKKGTEWFHIGSDESKQMLIEFKESRGMQFAKGTAIPYQLRAEQEAAVSQTFDYFMTHEDGEFLWNAKPRFGKTLATYDLCKRLLAKKQPAACHILIVTNRPAIANSWYEDFVKFLGDESGFVFVSETDALKGKPFVLTQEEYLQSMQGKRIGEYRSKIEFISLQDLKGSIGFGGKFNKLDYVKQERWELLVIDEAHEGVDTYKTDTAFYQLKRRFTLHLSGTPFKALANDKFEANAIFNWTYADEQRSKRDWDENIGTNPYAPLPRLNLFTYQMSEIIRDEVRRGIEIDGETEEYAFDLNEFFATTPTGAFVHSESVDKFLDALTRLEKYPFSTPELRAELRHTLWLLHRVDSAKALAAKLKKHPVFENYEIILAAGDGKLSDDEQTMKSLDKVKAAIKKFDKTITISVGQLTTGITIPEWSAVLMLSNMKSPALYMQAAFRSQNPWAYHVNGEHYVKENAYVFDFDPARTLDIFEQFANNLSPNTSGGKGDSDARKQNIRELLNFFPVIGEDENGEMVELDAERVLSIPRKIRSLEVVRRGFMSNFLFQNISNIFGAPQEVLDIITQFTPVAEGDEVDVSKQTRDAVPVDENGDVAIPEETVQQQTEELFGDKIYGEVTETIAETMSQQADDFAKADTTERDIITTLQDTFKDALVTPVMEVAETQYGDDLRARDKREIERRLEQKVGQIAQQEATDFSIKKKELERDRQAELDQMLFTGRTEEEINTEFQQKTDEITSDFLEQIGQRVKEAMPTLTQEVVKTAETKKVERQKESIEDAVRNHLRGFSRTIPSFLMAYGDENTTLETFDQIIPDAVFKEVTSITLDEFRFLRDGGTYTDSTTGEQKQYQGKLFDPVVFNDAVQEFLALRIRLANYFDESSTEDIFDYIPPQKTNQIFTPKTVVKQMVDMLEQENPSCFDDPDKTFIDLYMKSGLYIAEIVKRLYNSPAIIQAFPDSTERLRHIFEKQVYGLAPTEIIYQIALHFILGFSEEVAIEKHNLLQFDSLPSAKDGTLEDKLDNLF